MSSQQNQERGKVPIEVKDDDGAKFHYFSLGKPKSMDIPHFQRMTVFGRDEYRSVLNNLFDFVGPLNELASRVYDRRDRNGKPAPPFPDDVAQLRSMLGNLMSLGIAKYVATDGDYGSGLYYSLTTDGVTLYLDFLVDKAPAMYKESTRRFVEVNEKEEKYYMPFLYLLMYFGTISKIDPLLISVFTNDKKPIFVKDVVQSYLDYEIRVNKQPKEEIEGNSFKERVTMRLRSMINNRIVEMRRVDGKDFLALTDKGRRDISPAIKKMSLFMNEVKKFAIVRVERDEGGTPVGFWLTTLGVSLRREYIKKIKTELATARSLGDVVNPAMPIDEIEPDAPPTYRLELTTGKVYTISKKMVDKIKQIRLIPFFVMIWSACLFFVVIGFLMGSMPVAIGSIIFGVVSFLIFILIMGVEEIRIKIKN